MTDSARTEEIRARVEKATPAPWHQGDTEDHEAGDADVVYNGAGDWLVQPLLREADADFIAHARSDVPYLLTELTALREEVERLKGALEKYGYHEHGCSFRPTRAGRITGVPCDCGLHKAALSPSPAQEQP